MGKFLVLADFPNFDDPERNMRCGAGRYIWHLLKCAGAPPDEIAIEFLYNSKRDMKAGYNRFSSIIGKHKPKVVVALGQTVFNEFNLGDKVMQSRGSVYPVKKSWGDMYVVPTYGFRELQHPHKMYAEEPMKKGVYTLGDIRRARIAYENGWEIPEERFNLTPSLEDVTKFVDDAIKNQWLLGTDIEATGLNIEHAEIVVLGFAWSESDCIVIPFKKEGGADYWSRREWNIVSAELKRLMKHGKFMFQNGVGYDVPLLRARGWPFKVESMVCDTMVWDHCLNSEYSHNIGDISSRYGKQQYWKSVMDDFWGTKIYTADQLLMRKYNARDCVALHQIKNGIENHIDELVAGEPLFKDTRKILEKSMKEAQACVYMEESGMTLDRPRYRKWVKFLNESLEEVETELREINGLPDRFSFTSSDHKRWWIYHEKIGKLDAEKLKLELDSYELVPYNYQYECVKCGRKKVQKFYPDVDEIPNSITGKCPTCKSRREDKFVRTKKEPSLLKLKNKDTNKYRELLGNYELANMKLLFKLKGYRPLQTASGKSALDKDAIVRYQIAVHRRLEEISKSSRRDVGKWKEKYDEEEKNLKHLVRTLDLLKKYTKFKKLQDAFTSTLLDKLRSNGKIHPHFMVTGTATGRLSCKSPNFLCMLGVLKLDELLEP